MARTRLTVGIKDSRPAGDVLRQIAKIIGKSSVRVGVIAGKSPPRDDGLDNVKLAAIHEFGAPAANIPERSFLRSTYDANRETYFRGTVRLAQDILDGARSPLEAMSLLGLRMVADTKAAIVAGIGPALKPATIARKGSSLPLVDTGQLINSITFEATGSEQKLLPLETK